MVRVTQKTLWNLQSESGLRDNGQNLIGISFQTTSKCIFNVQTSHFMSFFFCCLAILNETQLVNNCIVGSIDQSKMRVWGKRKFASSQFCSHLYSGKCYCGEKVLLSIHIKSVIKFGEHLWKVRFEVWKKSPMCIAGGNREEEMCFFVN